MTPERWKRAEELYHEARARAPGERSAFLAEACPDDEELRHEVESLLSEPGSDDGFLETPVLVVPADLVAPMVGRSLGGYQLQTLLGIGGMGEVYRAHDPKLARDVAIKILPFAFTSDPDRLARFAREARMLAALNHQNICGIYGLEQAEGIQFLILELVEGQTLAQMLANRTASPASGAGLPLQPALTMARQIADALEVAHDKGDKGIVHRDLKPANIKITPDGVVKVLDFGLAKAVVEEGSSPDLTDPPEGGTADGRRGAVVGTAAYMSPEQARGRPVDKRTDIWAFGCVLYEMLTGRVAFPGDTVSDSIAKILEREPDWSLLPASTPPSIRRLLLRCLTKDPKKRLRDIGDVRLEIDAANEGAAGKAETTAPPVAAARWSKWLPWVAVVALAAGVVIRDARLPPAGELERRWTWKELKWEGSEWEPDITADGKRIAFLGDHDGETDLFERSVDGDEEPVNRTKHLKSLEVAAILKPLGYHFDGERLWFNAIFGEAKELLLADGSTQAFLLKWQHAPTWSPTGRLAFFMQRKSGDSLHCSDPDPAATQKPIPVKEPGGPDDETGLHRHNPVFSIDGNWLYYVRGYVRVFNQNDEMDIFRVSCSGGMAKRLTTLNSAITQLAMVDERTLLFVARDTDRSGPFLWILDIPTGEYRRHAEGPHRITSVAVSRNRQRAVVTQADPTPSLLLVPILDGPRQAVEDDVTPYPVGMKRALAPRYGGDDGSVYFLSGLDPRDGLWRFKDGKRQEIIKGSDLSLFEPPATSKDGRATVVHKIGAGQHRLMIWSSTGGLEPLATRLDVFGTADWSPNRTRIAVGGQLDADGVRGMFVIDVDGLRKGEPQLLRECDCSSPVWSPDGDFIVYSEGFSGQAELRAVRPDRRPYPLADAQRKEGTKGPLQVSPGGYRFRDRTRLVYLERPESTDFSEYDLGTGATRQITQLGKKGSLQSFDVEPGGNRIIFDRTLKNSNIWVADLERERKPSEQ